ncbi:hypothetical protein BC940DRAFT_320886 [Gongronella butleri]|nr:hypothetical protein BC940DRAFT_320886 [Gongronella butleri]
MLFCKSLSIDLIEPVVYLHGPKDKHTTNILRGIIRFRCKRTMYIDSVTLKFIGVSKTLWPEASQHWDKQVLVDSEIPISHTPMYLKGGKHAFPFEILLSNTLSESIECGLGHVRYKLICQIRTQSHWRSFLLPKTAAPAAAHIRAKRSVILVRLPSQDSPRCISQTHHLQEQQQLNMVIETAHVTPGAALPLSLHFSHPEAIVSLQQLSVKLIERQKFRAPSKQTTRILHHEITLQQQQQCWADQEARFIYIVPDSRSLQVHPTTTNRIIRVRHWIQVSLSLTLKNGETKEIWMDAPISVLLASLDDYHTLPVYQTQETYQQQQLQAQESRNCQCCTHHAHPLNPPTTPLRASLLRSSSSSCPSRSRLSLKDHLCPSWMCRSSSSYSSCDVAASLAIASSASPIQPLAAPLTPPLQPPTATTAPLAISNSHPSSSSSHPKKKKKKRVSHAMNPTYWLHRLYARHHSSLLPSYRLPPPPPYHHPPSASIVIHPAAAIPCA